MPRPRTFDEERAVDAAMRAFWTKGYESTSTHDLSTATGLGRSSIYNTFACKHDLFEKALRRYAEVRTASLLELLAGPGSIREKVRTVFWWTVDADPDDPLGCMTVNAVIELAPHDRVVAEMVRKDETVRLAALGDAFEAARRAGEIDGDPEMLARFVLSTVAGMQVQARGGTGRDGLAAIAEVALRAL
ncbi:TetR/AcrR family transcriptional regulator [Actinomycetes bacterium KLBMP 9759]